MHYLESLRKFFEIKKEDKKPCQQILGSALKVDKFAQFWEQQQDDLMLVMAAKTHEYITVQSFTEAEVAVYKKAVSDIGLFFAQCWGERKERKDKRKEKME